MNRMSRQGLVHAPSTWTLCAAIMSRRPAGDGGAEPLARDALLARLGFGVGHGFDLLLRHNNNEITP